MALKLGFGESNHLIGQVSGKSALQYPLSGRHVTIGKMSESLLSKEQVKDGYERFVAVHPDVRAQIEAITLELADALGTDLSELRRVEVVHAMEDFAAREGVESFEYLLRYAITSESERSQILESRRESVERIIGRR